jgi:hypothetical protein
MARKSAKVDLAKLDKNKILKVMEERIKAVKLVPITSIHPNPWNKNKMGGPYFAALKANIANPEIGFTTPILLRPHSEIKGEFEIVDGEHRFKACQELGMESIPAINLDNVPDALAKYLMLEQNAVRGETKDEDIKRIIQEIESDEEWKELMGDFDAWSGLVTEEQEDDTSKYALDDEDLESTKDATVLVSLYLTQDQNDLFRKTTGQLRLANGYPLEAAFMEILNFYIESTGIGEPTGDDDLDKKDQEYTGNRIAADKAKAKAKKDKYAQP